MQRCCSYESPRQVTLEHSSLGERQTTLQFVEGFLDPFPGDEAHEPPPGYAFALRKGSRVRTEEMLDKHLESMGIFLWPYVRLGPEYGNILVYAEGLFETPLKQDEPLRPKGRVLRVCE